MGNMKWLFFLLLCMRLFSWSNVWGETIEPAHLPSLVSSLKIANSLEFCGELVPMKNQEVRERLEKELLLSLWDRPQVILWLKRSRRYLPYIEKILKKNGMPDDLKYISIAESALRPHVGSKKRAIGFWQFMKYTGRKYGLVINKRIDERRNIIPSTKAAVLYFKDLYETFDSWTLAAAAFNMGEDGLMSEIMEQETNNYYDLYLPLETQRYVPRILSVKLIFSDPGRYGFQLSENDYYHPIKSNRIKIDCTQDIPIRIVARAARTNFKMIKDLNPEIRGHYLARGKHNILIPKRSSAGFHARYERNIIKYLDIKEKRVYVVNKGDSLSSIADRYNIPLKSLIIWNRLDPNRPIHPGDHIIIHPRLMKKHQK